MDFLISVYERNNSNRRAWPIFDTFINTLSKCMQAYFVFYAFALTGAVHVPFVILLAIYLVIDRRFLAYPLIIPGTSTDIDTEYEINLIFQLFMGFFAGAVQIYFDAIFVIQLLHVVLMANIVCDKIRASERVLLARGSSQTDVFMCLRRVIQLQNDLRE